VRGGLADAAALEALADGADAVIHCAALIKARRPADFFAVNRDGAVAAAQAAAAAGARLLSMSSLAARQPELSHYARSKAEGDAAIMRVADASGLRWDALRPPAVYGPGDPETLKLLRWITRGLAPVPSGRAARVAMIHVADLAQAALAWGESGEATGAIYEIDDGHPGGRSWPEVVAAAAGAAGTRPRVFAAPAPLLIAGAAAYEGLARALGRTPMVTAGKLRELCWPDWRCSPEAFQARFGWRPSRDLETGLRETLDWYRKAGWL
jgi:nucleoside-diphosphate-sugar epimerase